MKSNPFLITAISLLLLFSSCKKLQLTRATEKGANTFSCIIGGKVFKTCFGGLFSDPPLTAYAGGSGTLNGGIIQVATINAACNEKMPYKDFYIELRNFHGVGSYLLSDSNNYCSYEERYPDKRYVTTAISSGKVTITKDDRTNYILSGKFEGTLVNRDTPSDQIVIKSGRFDIKYR
jgi:hypothetical protein